MESSFHHISPERDIYNIAKTDNEIKNRVGYSLRLPRYPDELFFRLPRW